jgi:chemotaxis protein CheC
MCLKDKNAGKVLEVIREFANIGAGNAATALASILDMELVNEVTSCSILPLSRVGNALGGDERVVAGTYTQLCGDLKSGILVVFPEDSARMLLKKMTGEEANLQSMSDLHASALCEAGNICLCWYLVAVSRMIDTDLIPAPPDAAVDLLGAILDLPLAAIGTEVDTAIAVHTVFKSPDTTFDGYFLMLPEKKMLSTIMDKMGETWK